MTMTGFIALILGVAVVGFIFWKLQKNKTMAAETGNQEKKASPPKSVAQKAADMPSIASSVSNQPEKKDDAVFAAISLALHLYLNDNVHDVESNVITIKRSQKRYSPWSSKIYSMNNFQ